jgi:rod shape-determining protein MreB
MNLLDYVLGMFSNDIAIDLGTANVRVYVKGQGVVLREPSVVAVDRNNNQVVAVGEDAKAMLGRTPANITAIRPMRDGVIADFEVTEKMLKHFIRKVHNRRAPVRPLVVIAIPSGVTEVEKRAVRDSAEQAGAREVFLIEEPMASAIGVGLPIAEASGNMIVDIGGGTTEVAVISLEGIVCNRSVRIGGDEIDEAIIVHLRNAYNVLIGERMAEACKIKIGSAFPLKVEQRMALKGRDLVTGLPRTVEVTSEEIREAIAEPLDQIVEAVKLTLEKTPPELSSDIVDRGIFLSGGTSQLQNLAERLRHETGLPVSQAEDPQTSVVLGCGKLLDGPVSLLRRLSVQEREYF